MRLSSDPQFTILIVSTSFFAPNSVLSSWGPYRVEDPRSERLDEREPMYATDPDLFDTHEQEHLLRLLASRCSIRAGFDVSAEAAEMLTINNPAMRQLTLDMLIPIGLRDEAAKWTLEERHRLVEGIGKVNEGSEVRTPPQRRTPDEA